MAEALNFADIQVGMKVEAQDAFGKWYNSISQICPCVEVDIVAGKLRGGGCEGGGGDGGGDWREVFHEATACLTKVRCQGT